MSPFDNFQIHNISSSRKFAPKFVFKRNKPTKIRNFLERGMSPAQFSSLCSENLFLFIPHNKKSVHVHYLHVWSDYNVSEWQVVSHSSLPFAALGSSSMTLTKLTGNMPSLSPTFPLSQSSLTHSLMTMTSPVEKLSSPEFSPVKSNNASHLPVAWIEDRRAQNLMWTTRRPHLRSLHTPKKNLS